MASTHRLGASGVDRADVVRRFNRRRRSRVPCVMYGYHRLRPTDTGRGEPAMAVDAYCVKCREKREMKDAEEVTMKNGRPAMQGVCPVCGTKLFRMLSNKDAEKAK